MIRLPAHPSEHPKTKARYIIPGWAKSRSTASLGSGGDVWFFNSSLADDPERQRDKERDRRYHRQQAVMEQTFLAGKGWKR